ncbi:MAG: L-threonylcarbamoyladenylate synthase [Candidatus Helarchaeota archaeon]
MKSKIVKIDPNNIDRKKIETAANLIKEGKLVVYPTDTVYGLGTDPLNILAVRKLLEVKGRPEQKGLPVLASSLESVKRIANLSIQVEVIGKAYWPGPLTMIVPKSDTLPPIVTGGRKNVAIRIPQNPIALLLSELSDGLIIGTSANKSNQPSPKNAAEANKQIGKKIDLIIDGGPSKLGISSTIIDMTKKPPKIIREGPITLSF